MQVPERAKSEAFGPPGTMEPIVKSLTPVFRMTIFFCSEGVPMVRAPKLRKPVVLILGSVAVPVSGTRVVALFGPFDTILKRAFFFP